MLKLAFHNFIFYKIKYGNINICVILLIIILGGIHRSVSAYEFNFVSFPDERQVSQYLIEFDKDLKTLFDYYYLNDIGLKELHSIFEKDSSKGKLKLRIEQVNGHTLELGAFKEIAKKIENNSEVNYYPIIIMFSIYQSYFIKLFYFCLKQDSEFKPFIIAQKIKEHKDIEVMILNIVNRGYKKLTTILNKYFQVEQDIQGFDSKIMEDFIHVRNLISHFNGNFTQYFVKKIHKQYRLDKISKKIVIHKKDILAFMSNLCAFISKVDLKVVEYVKRVAQS